MKKQNKTKNTQVTVKTKYLFIKNRNTPTSEKRAVKLAKILYIFFIESR